MPLKRNYHNAMGRKEEKLVAFWIERKGKMDTIFKRWGDKKKRFLSILSKKGWIYEKKERIFQRNKEILKKI